MTQRNYDDVPQHLKDKYTPKLKDAFDQAAQLEAKISKKDPNKVSAFDMANGMRIALKIVKIAKDFKKAGGSDDDLNLVMDKALELSNLNP